ncbi:hypothetical protein QYF61_000908, partial [Mycteria americana]
MLSIDSGGFSSSCALTILTPTLHKWAASLYSSQVTCPCFHCLRSSLLLFTLTSRSRLSHAGLFPSLPDFLHLGTESSCALWKASLKTCQLCSPPLSLRTISQGVLLTNSLKSWKFAFLKFRDCELHQCMITAAQAASNLDVIDELTCTGDHQVQYCIPSGTPEALLCTKLGHLSLKGGAVFAEKKESNPNRTDNYKHTAFVRNANRKYPNAISSIKCLCINSKIQLIEITEIPVAKQELLNSAYGKQNAATSVTKALRLPCT